ncbi:MAG: endolytic transglycosylase MltG [bacterium]
MRPTRKLMLLALLIFIGAAALLAGSLYIGATRWRSPVAAEVEIRPGSSVRAIALELARNRVIGTPKLFEIIARGRGLARTLRAGTYEFPAGMTMSQVLAKIARGEVKQYAFTIVEGWTINEIKAALSAQPFLNGSSMPEEFVKLATDPAVIQELGFEGMKTLEGYLFPDTYLIAKPFDPKAFIKRLVARFREVWAALDANAIAASNMSQRQIITIASVVEKETGAAQERPLIASVFFNRLRQNMPLQSDPTTIYGLPNFDGNLHKQDMLNPHPYNTYMHPGLPPGPICNPGKASIDAVIHPARSDYLYFVAKGDGTHQFSSTLGEHLAAVKEYQIEPARAARNNQ